MELITTTITLISSFINIMSSKILQYLSVYVISMLAWITVVMWHLRRQHQIREKSTILYYVLLVFDGIGYVADILANYTWASLILVDMPRFTKRELTLSQHMGRINDTWVDTYHPTIRQRWAHWVSSKVCGWLNSMDPTGHHC